MLKAHKNRIYEQIVESGYRPEQFELSEGLKAFVENDEYAQFGIKLRDSNLVFYVLIAPHSFDLFRYQCTLFAPDWPTGSNTRFI